MLNQAGDDYITVPHSQLDLTIQLMKLTGDGVTISGMLFLLFLQKV